MDAFELADMRIDLLIVMPDVCNILADVQTSDGMGGYSHTWGTAYYSIPCRLDDKGGKVSTAGAALYPFGEYMMTLPYNVIITAQNRIEHNAIQYNILHLDKARSWETHTEAYLSVVVP